MWLRSDRTQDKLGTTGRRKASVADSTIRKHVNVSSPRRGSQLVKSHKRNLI